MHTLAYIIHATCKHSVLATLTVYMRVYVCAGCMMHEYGICVCIYMYTVILMYVCVCNT